MAGTLPPPPEGFEAVGSELPPPPEGFEVAETSAVQPESLKRQAAAAVVGASRNVPFAAPAAAALNVAKTYLGLHPAGVPTEGSMGERYSAAREQLERAKSSLEKQYPKTVLGSQLASGLAMPSVVSGVRATPAVKALLTGGEQAIYGGLYGAEEGGLEGAAKGAGFSGLAGSALGRMLPGVAPHMSEVAEAAGRQGVHVPWASASDKLLPKLASAGVETTPLGGWAIGSRAQRGIEELGSAAERLAGPVRSKLDVGESARSRIADWVQNTSAREAERHYSAVDRLINPNAVTPASATTTALQGIMSKRAAARLPTEPASAKLVMDAATDPNGLTYAGMKDLRTHLGGMLGAPSIVPGDLQRGEIKTLYEALSNDLENAVRNSGGPQAVTAWRRANAEYSRIVGQRNQLARIIGKDATKAGETVYSTLANMAAAGSKGDIRRLQLARQVMSPAGWREINSGVINDLGRDVAGEFSPARFRTGYAKLSDAGKDALFGPVGNQLRNSLEDINLLSSAFERTARFRNVSRTATTGTWGASAYGLFVDPVTTISANLGAGAVGLLLSHPVTARNLANLQRMQLGLLAGGTTATRVTAQRALEKLAASAKSELGLDIPTENKPVETAELRPARASGGRIKSLEREANRACKALGGELKPITQMPDDVVVNALRIAKGQ